MSLPAFSAQDRLLVVAPHPDDETIAAGVAIQSALAAGAAVRVLHATDGDNNPWPQRWLEKRIRIGATERARWAALRRAEARRAHAALGVDDRAIEAQFFGWPDQGLTDALMRDDAAVAGLAHAVAGFRPSCMLVPALDDDHPDHSALHVMSHLALLRAGGACTRLAYLVHGGDAAMPEADATRLARKRKALESYASQLALSRARLERFATRSERFVATAASTAGIDAGDVVRVPLGAFSASPCRHDVLLVLALADRVLRLRAPWPRLVRGNRRLRLVDPAHGGFDADIIDDVVHVAVGERVLAAYAKRHRAGARVIVYDRTRWHAAGADVATAAPVIARGVATGLG